MNDDRSLVNVLVGILDMAISQVSIQNKKYLSLA